MDEASQSSFYGDDQLLTELSSYLKPDGGVLTFNSIYQQLEDGTPNPSRFGTEKCSHDKCDFTVPVCDEQICQLAKLRSQQGMDNSTSLAQVPSVENHKGPSTGLAGEKPSITCNLKDMRHSSPEVSTECGILLSPPCKRPRLHDDSCERSKKDGGGKSGATQCELYLDWNVHRHFESELVNKVPAGWPAIGVKSVVTENNVVSQKSTLSFFALVEQAHLLSEEQLHEIRKLEAIKHPDQCHRSTSKRNKSSNETTMSVSLVEKFAKKLEHPNQCRRSTLKRNTSSHETSVSRAEKFAKIGIDALEETSSEDHEFYVQEETSNNCNDGLNVYADQEVPIQEVNSYSSRQAVEKDANLHAHENSDNLSSKVCNFEMPTVKDIKNDFSLQCSTDFRKASSRDEPNNGGSCSKTFCLKFDEKNQVSLTDGRGEFPAATESTDQATGVVSSDNDQPQMSSGPAKKPQTVIITNEHVVPYIACKYPLLPQKMTNESELCSSLRTIDERDLIDDQCPNDVDGGLLQSRNGSLARDASSLLKKEDVQDLVNNDITKRLQGPERLNSSGLNLSKPVSHIERFDKVKFENQDEECSIDEQPVSLEHKLAPSSTSRKENKENAEVHTPFSVVAESINGHLQDAHNSREATHTDSIQSKGNKKQQVLGTVLNFAAQENSSKLKMALQKNTEQQNSDDDKENKREFAEEYSHQRNTASHSGIENEKKSNTNCHRTESNNFRAQIASGMLDLDGPELLQFAMMFVQGAIKKSQTAVVSCDDPLQCDKDKNGKSGAAPAFSWKKKLSYHSQHAPSEPSDDKKSSITSGSSLIDESGELTDGDNNEGPHLIRPLSSTSCNRPFRLGLSRKHSNKPLHPYFKKQPRSELN